jgi:hypothetical protein
VCHYVVQEGGGDAWCWNFRTRGWGSAFFFNFLVRDGLVKVFYSSVDVLVVLGGFWTTQMRFVLSGAKLPC